MNSTFNLARDTVPQALDDLAKQFSDDWENQSKVAQEIDTDASGLMKQVLDISGRERTKATKLQGKALLYVFL